MRKADPKRIARLLDANFNRAKEGLRVCEDICRFILDDKKTTREYKKLRHELTAVLRSLEENKASRVIQGRDVSGDIGRTSTSSELKREDPGDIFHANSQRVKESVRVLEEFFKLFDHRCAEALKDIRYQLYRLEKRIVQKFS